MINILFNVQFVVFLESWRTSWSSCFSLILIRKSTLPQHYLRWSRECIGVGDASADDECAVPSRITSSPKRIRYHRHHQCILRTFHDRRRYMRFHSATCRRGMPGSIEMRLECISGAARFPPRGCLLSAIEAKTSPDFPWLVTMFRWD